jgi:hypothetical protein
MVVMDEPKLLDIAKVSKKDYQYCKLKISPLIPQYCELNRKDLILNKINGVREKYELGMDFYWDTKTILMKLWERIKCTTDNVIAGLASSIAILCHYRDKVTISAICKTLNIEMSTIQGQVKRKIIQRYKMAGFRGLVSSADLLKTVIYKLGVFETNEQAEQEKQFEAEIEADMEEDIKETQIRSQKGEMIGLEIITEDSYNILKEKNYIFAVKTESYGPIYILVSFTFSKHKCEQNPLINTIETKSLRKIIPHYPNGPP